MERFDPNTFYAREAWRHQYFALLWQPVHTEITVTKWAVPHPVQAGFIISVGEAAGQKADYRYPLEDNREVHVREYDHHYTLHLDRVSAVKDPIGHLASDAPHWIFLGLLGLLLAILLWPRRGES